VPAKVAGERQTGFVSAVDGVAGLAAADGVLAFDKVSGSDGAELVNPGLAAPALADAATADPTLVAPELADTVLLVATTGSGAEAPSGLAGMSGWPLDRDSSGGGIAALGTVASERLPPSLTVGDGEPASAWAESAAGDGPGSEEDPGPDAGSDSEGESGAEAVLGFAWTLVVAVEEAREERAEVPEVLLALAPAPSAGAFALASPVSRDFRSGSAPTALDFVTVLSG
jgi:hypothetical protein